MLVLRKQKKRISLRNKPLNHVLINSYLEKIMIISDLSVFEAVEESFYRMAKN